MAAIGTITVPVHLKITTELDGTVMGTLVPETPATTGNQNVSITLIAAGMAGCSPAEFADLSTLDQEALRRYAHNLTQLFVILPR